jgi:WD40 repeat protein
VYHKEYQAEITRHKRFYDKDYLRRRRGDRTIVAKYPENIERISEVSHCRSMDPENDLRYAPKKEMLDFSLNLDYVYGFRSFDLREGLFFVPDYTLIYTVGSMIIKWNLGAENPKQDIFCHHSTEVSCFDVYKSEDLDLVASSEMSAENNITLWDFKSFKIKAQIKNLFEKGVSKIKFSNDGKRLAVIGITTEDIQLLVILSIATVDAYVASGHKEDKIESTAKIPSGPVLDMCFDREDHNLFLAIGKDLYSVRMGGKLKVTKFDWHDITPRIITSISYFEDNKMFTATITGDIVSWRRKCHK